MWNWILIGGLYAFGMGSFAVLGGVRSAADAFRRWGESASHRERAHSVSF